MKNFIFVVAALIIIGLVAALPPSSFLLQGNSSPVLQLSNIDADIFNSPAYVKDGVGGGHYNSSNSTAIEANITQSMRDFMDGNWTGSQ